MKIVRIFMLVMAAVIGVVSGAFFYFVYVPEAPEPTLSGADRQHTIQSNSITRTFSSYLPQGLADNSALVFVLHGSNGTGDQIRKAIAYEFDILADNKGFLVVYPDGYEKHWNDCRESADYSANTQDIDDVAFFADMIAFFADKGTIDRDRVFVTGHSNGGHMAYRLALEAPELIAAIAPISANLPVDSNLGCKKSGRPVSVAIFAGTEDPINPFGGGMVSVMGNTSRGEVISSIDTAYYWKNLASISQPDSVISHPEADGVESTTVTEQRWQNESGLQIRLYSLVGSGHVIPSRITRFPRVLGGDAADISGPDEIVSFFLGLSSNKWRSQSIDESPVR